LSAIESRAATLEAQVGFLNGRMDRVETKLDMLSEHLTRAEERIAQLPTKEQIVKLGLGFLVCLTAVTAFQEKIRTFLGL